MTNPLGARGWSGLVSALLLAVLVSSGVAFAQKAGGCPEVSVYFSPFDSASQQVSAQAAILEQIHKAKHQILVQAYGFSDRVIDDSLISAENRGVRIGIILDKSNEKALDKRLRRSGIRLGFDDISGIAHNKIMVIDSFTTITGSYNFSKAAKLRNVENLLVIKDSAIAMNYLKNWWSRAHALSTHGTKWKDLMPDDRPSAPLTKRQQSSQSFRR